MAQPRKPHPYDLRRQAAFRRERERAVHLVDVGGLTIEEVSGALKRSVRSVNQTYLRGRLAEARAQGGGS